MERAHRRGDHGDEGTRAQHDKAAGKRTRSERLTRRKQVQAAVRAADESEGEPLPDDVRGGIEYLAGADLSAVRVHAGGASAEAAASLRADAYTTGQDIHFAAGKYAPETAAGKALLTHEIGHALQHRAGAAPAPASATGPRTGEIAVSQPGDAVEREAETFAASIAAGSPAAMPGIAPAGASPTIARWGEWCEDLFGGDEDEAGATCEDDEGGGWLGWVSGGDEAGDGPTDAGDDAFTPIFGKAPAMVVDYNQTVHVPVEITNAGELPAGDWFDVELASVDSATGALLHQETVQDAFGGLIELLAFGVESDMGVHARVTIHHADGGSTAHTVKAATVSVRRPEMSLAPVEALDYLVPGDTFSIAAVFQHLHEPEESPLSVWPRVQSLGAGDAATLSTAVWDGDRMIFTLTASEAGAFALHVDAHAPGYVAADSFAVKIHETATGGEACVGFDPWFAEPVAIDAGYNDRIEVPVELLNAEEWLASGVERDVGFGSAEVDGGMIYADDLPPPTFTGVTGGETSPALGFTADQEGTWRIHAAVTFTDPATGSAARYTPHVATVNVGSRAAREAANKPEVDKQLEIALELYNKTQVMQSIGLDLLRDHLLASSRSSMSDAVIEKTSTAIAGLLLKGLVTIVAPGAGPVLLAILDKASTAAAGVAGKAAVEAASSVRTGGMITAASLRAVHATALAEAGSNARIALIEDKESYYLSPDGVQDATELAEGLAAVDNEMLQREVYLTALGGWTQAMAAHDAPWSDEGELRVKVRFGDDGVEIVNGTIDGLPPEVLDYLRTGPNTIASLVDHGVHVEVYQTGDAHFELTSDVLLASPYHTGSAAYFLVDRANAKHGTDLDVTLPGSATAAAWHVWTNEILPLSLDRVLTE